MGIHHKIKPHHHYAIWALSVAAVLASAVMYNTISVDQLQAETEPSERTQKFFGFDKEEGEREFVMPEACKTSPQQEEMQRLSNEMQATSSELATLQQKDPATLTAEEQARIQALQTKMSDLQSQMNALQQQAQSGPSDECKRAMIAQMVTQMEAMQAKMEGKFFGTLTKVDTTVVKVEGSLDDLASAGVEQAKIDTIKSHLATIKAATATLRSFFSKMQSAMQSWIDLAKSDPLKAFDQMQQGQGFANEGDASTAAKAADDMVAAFEDLVTILDEIAAQEESNGTDTTAN